MEDPQQPLLLLQAAIVSVEGGKWQAIEREIVNTIDEVNRFTGASIDRLHFYEMVQRKPPFDQVSYPKIFEWIERILDIAKANDTKYVSLPIPKTALGTRKTHGVDGIYIKNVTGGANDATQENLTFPFSPYVFGYQFLVLLIEQVLAQLDGYGLLIFDQRREGEILSQLNVYRALRAAKLLSRITENPIFRGSQTNAMLTLPDFTAYIFGRPIADKYLGRNTPKELRSWEQKYIDPQTIEAGWPDIEESGALEGESFEDSLKRMSKGEGPPLIPLQLAILALMNHEIFFCDALKKLTSIAQGFKILSGRINVDGNDKVYQKWE